MPRPLYPSQATTTTHNTPLLDLFLILLIPTTTVTRNYPSVWVQAGKASSPTLESLLRYYYHLLTIYQTRVLPGNRDRLIKKKAPKTKLRKSSTLFEKI